MCSGLARLGRPHEVMYVSSLSWRTPPPPVPPDRTHPPGQTPLQRTACWTLRHTPLPAWAASNSAAWCSTVPLLCPQTTCGSIETTQDVTHAWCTETALKTPCRSRPANCVCIASSVFSACVADDRLACEFCYQRQSAWFGGCLFRPIATVSQMGLMESCLHRRCRGGPPPPG